MAVVYLIHFERPIGNMDNPRGMAQHYLGFSRSLKKRLADHRCGHRTRIMIAVNQAGIPWVVARTWPNGTRELEKHLKARHNARKLCPICLAEERSHAT